MWAIYILFLAVAGALWWLGKVEEGFAYRKNPCAEFKNCSACAGAAACGWCSDLKVCQPMAQDGFPIRTKDSSTEEDVRFPYLKTRLCLESGGLKNYGLLGWLDATASNADDDEDNEPENAEDDSNNGTG